MNAQRLFDELYYWNHLGIGDDIVNFRAHRKQYGHYVDFLISLKVKKEEIPAKVEMLLMLEAQKPILFQRTFWRCLRLKVNKWLGL